MNKNIKAAENMSNDHVPAGATHTEADGTYWKEIDGEWYFYLALFGWKPYIGLKNASFYGKLIPIS